MKPLFKRKELDNDDCKWLLSAVMEKVLSKAQPDQLAPGKTFMNDKRKAKVTELFESYVKKRKAMKRAGDA